MEIGGKRNRKAGRNRRLDGSGERQERSKKTLEREEKQILRENSEERGEEDRGEEKEMAREVLTPVPEPPNVPIDKDEGYCLTMHQPYASLLVEGIKKVEGRSWMSHKFRRGRLWISSSRHTPSKQEILQLEQHYRLTLEKGEEAVFPKEYPPQVLLGYVDVDRQISHQQYLSMYAGGEDNSSNYVFVCTNPTKLKFPIEMKGDHKVWKLEESIWKLAKNSF